MAYTPAVDATDAGRAVGPRFTPFWAAAVALVLVHQHLLGTVTDDEFHDLQGPLAAVDRIEFTAILCVRGTKCLPLHAEDRRIHLGHI